MPRKTAAPAGQRCVTNEPLSGEWRESPGPARARRRGPQGQSPAQVRALLAAIETDQPELTAFFGCLYYAYLRPGEAVYLRKMDCIDLPGAGWGELLLTGNAPHAGAEWTDAGTTRDERQLKHGAHRTLGPCRYHQSWSS